MWLINTSGNVTLSGHVNIDCPSGHCFHDRILQRGPDDRFAAIDLGEAARDAECITLIRSGMLGDVIVAYAALRAVMKGTGVKAGRILVGYVYHGLFEAIDPSIKLIGGRHRGAEKGELVVSFDHLFEMDKDPKMVPKMSRYEMVLDAFGLLDGDGEKE